MLIGVRKWNVAGRRLLTNVIAMASVWVAAGFAAA